MTWWSWISVGLLLLVAEAFFPAGFFLFLFGVAAMIVGVLVGIGLPITFNVQLALFGILSVVLAFTMAKRLRQWFNSKADAQRSDVVGADVVLSGSIAPGEEGNGQLWGASWKVKNIGAGPLAAGAKCKVVEVSGVTLHVQ